MLAPAFDHSTDLPAGHHIIEASAGTGKTFTLVGLAARYLATGRTTASGLLLVTFSRASTRELRARLLDRLVRADRLMQQVIASGGLDDGADGGASGGSRASADSLDVVEQALLDVGDPAELQRRAGNIRQALRDMDLATVTTIHGLCDELLRRTGEGLDSELSAIDDVAVDQLLSDVIHRIVRHDPECVHVLPEQDAARAIVRAALSVPQEALVPDCHPEWMRYQAGLSGCIAKAAKLDADRRRRNDRTHSYDDLLTTLCERLGGAAGQAAIDPTRPLYTVGLVDEFQDTDPTQWQILSQLFPDSGGADGRSLIMVGDPKQSIYGFRGADVTTYVGVRGPRPDSTLAMNYRADAPVVKAATTLFEGCDLGDGIAVQDIEPHHKGVRVSPTLPAFHVRVVMDVAPTPRGYRGVHLVGPTREFIAADVAAHTVELLHDDMTVEDPDEPSGEPRRVMPQDITVLVRTNAQAAMVQRQLGIRGVPSVLNGVGNVLQTRAARDWLTLLRALQQPDRGGPARLAALTDLIDGSPEDLAVPDESLAEARHVLLHELAAVLEGDGVAALLRALDEHGMTVRLMGLSDGIRRLVDLQHVGELIHAQARGRGLGVTGLISWLEHAIVTAADVPSESQARRLADAGSAVEVMTAHSAKGLERGIVLAPYLWDPPWFREDVLRYIDDEGNRRVDVGGTGSSPHELSAGRSARLDAAKRELAREELRLAYVAVTRARHHVVMWWGSASRAAESPLAAMLRCEGVADAQLAFDGAMDLAAEHPHLYKATAIEDQPPETAWDRPTETLPAVAPPALSHLRREIDRGWRRTSYSGLVRAAEEAAKADLQTDMAVAGATDDGLAIAQEHGEDEPDDRPLVRASDTGELSPEVTLSTMPGGSEVGSAVHAVLEHLDFTAEDLPAAIDGLLDEHLRGTSVDVSDPALRERVVEGLAAAVRTPLGPAVGGVALRDLSLADRFDELAFEIPVLDGPAADRPGTVTLGHVADLLDHHLPDDDPLAGYAEHLRDGHGPIEMRGFLTGFIDLLARVPGASPGDPDRFLIADYKTNRLGDGTDPVLRVAHHDRASMVEAMVEHHYPIQAMLYLIAAHRFLRWRVPGYDLDRDLIGSAYLFVRGMTGPGGATQPDGTPNGVLLWRPPSGLVADLDLLLATGEMPGEVAA